MTIIRVRSPSQIIPLIHEHLVFFDPSYKPQFLEMLNNFMLNSPDSVFLIAAIEAEEVVGYVIAQNPGPQSQQIEVAQAWSKSINPRSVADELFARTVLWAVSLGKDSLRAETSRDEAIYQRFGFVPAERVVRYRIDPGTVDIVVESLRGKLWDRHKEQ